MYLFFPYPYGFVALEIASSKLYVRIFLLGLRFYRCALEPVLWL